METITSSYNLFVDSSRSHTAGSKGDDFLVNLQYILQIHRYKTLVYVITYFFRDTLEFQNSQQK